MTAPAEEPESVDRPTLIVMHPKENRRKCSVWPLKGRPDLQFVNFPRPAPVTAERYVRLGLGGPVISRADRQAGLLLLDATWRHAERMEHAYETIPVRSLPPLKTAYPRRSVLFDDPDEGLATVEALYAAYVLSGRDGTGLLDSYRWKDAFLAANAEILA